MRTRLAIVSLLLIGSFIPGLPLSEAGSCTYSGEDPSSAGCSFSCDHAGNSVTATASIDQWYNQWRTVSADAYCNGTWVTGCDGTGDCISPTGYYGSTGSGSCVGWASGGTVSGGCVANDCNCFASVGAVTATFSSDLTGAATGEVCRDGACWPVEAVCVIGVGMACGIGVTEEELTAIYAHVLLPLA